MVAAVANLFPEVVNERVPGFKPPALPVAPATTALARMSTHLSDTLPSALTPGQTPVDPTEVPFSAASHLPPDQLAVARERAVQLVDAVAGDPDRRVSGNTQVLVTYGNQELEPVNALIKQLLETENEVELPELDQRMRLLKRQVREIEGKYVADDPKAVAFYTKWKTAILSKLRIIQGSWEMLREDVKSMNDHINDLERMLEVAIDELRRTIAQKDVYYEDNEREIGAVFRVIAVMELASFEAARRAADVVIDENDPLTRGRERRDTLAKISDDLQTRAGRFEARLMLAFGTSVDLRGSRDLDVGLATLLSDLIRITIPTIRAFVWKLMKAKKAAGYARKAGVVTDFSQEAADMYNKVSVDTAGQVATAIYRPLLEPEQIVGMAVALDRVADVVVTAMNAGATSHEANRRAITQALGILETSSDKVARARLKLVLDRLETVDVPSVIPPDFARKVLAIEPGARTTPEPAPASA